MSADPRPAADAGASPFARWAPWLILAAIYAGASQVLVDADLVLSEDLTTPEIEAALDSLEERVRARVPDIERVRVLLNSPQE